MNANHFTRATLYSRTRDLMDHHGLQDWEIRIGSARNIAGMCYYSRRLITMSLFLANARDKHHTEDTILHEIAHAIAGHKAGHGKDWKEVCIRIGAKPERCFDSAQIDPAVRYKYAGFCPNHTERVIQRNRRASMTCRCGVDIYWQDMEDPNSTPEPFRQPVVTKLSQALQKHGATITDDGVFYAPKGHVWRAEGMHYIDPTLSYYSETDSGRERSASATAKVVLSTVNDGLEKCDCGCIDWID